MKLTGQNYNFRGILYLRISVWTILLGLLFSGSLARAETFYIDPSSTSTATPDGSIEKPFKTWDDIPWVAKSTYLQKRGTICEASRVVKPTVDDVTLGAYGSGERPIIKSLVGDRAKAIEITSSNRVTIKDLEVYSVNDIVCAILLSGEGPHVVNNCVLHDCSWGMRVFNLTGKLTISNCEIYDIGDDGIYTENTDDIEVFGCNIHHVNADLPIRSTAGGDCIQISGDQGYLYIHDNVLDHSAFGRKFCLIIGSAYENNDIVPDEALVENNVMIGYYDSEEVTSGIYLKKTIKHLTFRYNIVKNASTGIWLNADATAHNNIFIDCSEGVTINSGKTVKVYNNTFVNNYIGVGSNYGSVGYIYNNIFMKGDYTETFLKLYGDITSDYNCFSEESSNIFNGYSTLKEWQENQGRDKNSLVADPEFVNLTNENFHIKSTSKCRDRGMVLDFIVRDMDGTKVPLFDGPDIGAFEYTEGSDSGTGGGDSGDTTTAENKSPEVYVTYSNTAPVGIVSSIDASESFDPDNDNLSYSWVAPEGIALSSISSPTIEIMPDDDLLPAEYTIQLLVSDGENTTTKDLDFNVVPYNPNIKELKISSIEASTYQVPNYPENLVDDDLSTRWAAQGMKEWVLFELKSPSYVDYIKLAFFNGDDRAAYFDISGSVDKENWQPIMTDYSSCGFSETKQAYPLEESKASNVYNYIKVTGFCNSQNDWNSFTEFKAYGTVYSGEVTGVSDNEMEAFKVYPNPADGFFNLDLGDMTGNAIIQVVDMNGRLIMETTRTGSLDSQINIENLNEGVYFVKVYADNIAFRPQRLIVR